MPRELRGRSYCRVVERSLEFDGVVIEVISSDDAAVTWLTEFLDPWWRPTRRAADWRLRVTVSATGYRAAAHNRPDRIEPRACFLFDQQVLSLPAWDSDGCTIVEDAERSLYFTVGDHEVHVVADPATNRWRFPVVWLLTEIAASRLRGRCLDLHAAAIEEHGRVVVIAGPKLSGKSTLALEVLGGGGRWVGNDRVLVHGLGHAPRVRGVPSAVKLRPDTAVRLPGLSAIAGVQRPYLLSRGELAVAERTADTNDDLDLAWTPAQIATILGVDRVAEAPLGAFVFPQLRPDTRSWEVQALSIDELMAALTGSLYGGARPPGRPTIFEARAGGAHTPTTAQIEAAARAAPGYQLLLGPDAYDNGKLAAWILGSGLAGSPR
jgi:hypothetical protein